MSLHETVTVSPDGTEQIAIIDDNMVEGVEVFELHIAVAESRDQITVVPSERITITIDDDGKMVTEKGRGREREREEREREEGRERER